MNLAPEFLTLDDILEIHNLQIDTYGGIKGIRSVPLLESAIATPMATFDDLFLYGSLFEMAAAYAYHIAENQPFLDGNKRTALASSLVFLELNNIEINDPEMKLYDAMIYIANKTISKNDLARLLNTLVSK